MMPGVNSKALSSAQIDEKKMGHIEAIIQAMTPAERQKPEIINSSRKQRIAKRQRYNGSGGQSPFETVCADAKAYETI